MINISLQADVDINKTNVFLFCLCDWVLFAA
jgi:hypothetical protein